MRKVELYLMLSVIAGYGMSLSVVNLASSLKVFEITYSKSLLSLTVFTYNVLYAFMSSVWSRLFSGRFSRASLAFMSLLIIGVSSTVIGIASNVYLIIIFNALLGMAAAVIMPVMTTIVVDYIGKDSIAVTYVNTSSSIGMILGYTVAALITAKLSIDVLLTIIGILALSLSVIPTFFPPQFKVIEGRRVALKSLVPLITGRLRAIPSVIAHPNIVSNIKSLMYDISKALKYRLQRKIPLLILGTTTLFTAISLFFTPMPAFLRDLGLSNSEIYILSLISMASSTITYRFLKAYAESIESLCNLQQKLISFFVTKRVINSLKPIYSDNIGCSRSVILTNILKIL